MIQGRFFETFLLLFRYQILIPKLDMKNISLKLQQHIFQETDRLLKRLNMSRNKYINEAVEFYNNYQQKKLLEEQLMRESRLISKDSMIVLHEFEQLEDEL